MSRLAMFKKFDVTEEEKEFLRQTDGMGGLGSSLITTADIHSVIANFYLAKQIEESGKSSDRSAKIMTRLTWAIVIFTAMQGVSAVLTYIK